MSAYWKAHKPNCSGFSPCWQRAVLGGALPLHGRQRQNRRCFRTLAGAGRRIHETIIEDYSLTAVCLTPLMEELRRDRPEGMLAEMYEHFIGCDLPIW